MNVFFPLRYAQRRPCVNPAVAQGFLVNNNNYKVPFFAAGRRVFEMASRIIT
jgi:hypothetical protein